MLGEQRVSYTEPVLMARNSAQRIFLTVEYETVIGIYFEAAASKAAAHVVDRLPALNYLYLTAVKVRIAAAVPEMNVLYIEADLRIGRLDFVKLLLFLVVKCVNKLLTLLKSLNEYLDLNVGVLIFDCGSDHKSLATIVIKVKMTLAYANKVNVSVKTAVEGKVCHLRINAIARRVVNDNGELALLCKLVGDINAPCRISAVVVRELLCSNVNVSRRVCSADLKIVAIRCGKLRSLDALKVKAGAAEIIVSAIVSVLCVPSMWKIYLYALTHTDIRRVLDEQPVFIKT